MSHGKLTLYKVVVLGADGVGKTALTIQLCLNHFVETYDPTIEESYRKQVCIDGQPCVVEVLDTPGKEEYLALQDQWIRDGAGFVLIYDISSRSSFVRIEWLYNQIQRVKDAATGGPPTPVILVGNKCDQFSKREVSIEEGDTLAKQLQCEYVEASAKRGTNVEEAFYDVVRQLRRHELNWQPTARDDTAPCNKWIHTDGKDPDRCPPRSRAWWRCPQILWQAFLRWLHIRHEATWVSKSDDSHSSSTVELQA